MGMKEDIKLAFDIAHSFCWLADCPRVVDNATKRIMRSFELHRKEHRVAYFVALISAEARKEEALL